MTAPESESGDIFQIENFRRLAELMKANDINEVVLQRGTQRIRLRRGFPQASHAVAESIRMAPAAAPQPNPIAVAAAPAAAKPAASDEEAAYKYIRCQTVGTFYTSSSPDAPPFVKVGDQVGPETTVCIIEAMKVFNEIPAEISGRIVAILVQNGHPVEFDQPLFKIDPRV